MSSDFYNFFQAQLQNEVDFGPVMRFSLKRNDKNIKNFIFVEGSSDELFYGNTRERSLSEKCAYFYRLSQDNTLNDYKGKEAVFYSMRRLKQSDDLKKSLDRCMFIVDRDFSDTIKSRNLTLSEDDIDMLTTTYGHSMESYFLEKHNVNLLFQHLHLDYKPFYDLFCSFAKEASRYYALKAVITENYKSGEHIYYNKTYDDRDIFVFNFTGGTQDFFVGKSNMQKECKDMAAAIAGHPRLIKRANALQNKISSHPRYIRGHDAFSFLESYLKQKHQIAIGFQKNKFQTLKPVIRKYNVKLIHNEQ